jgi:hypothetical protein
MYEEGKHVFTIMMMWWDESRTYSLELSVVSSSTTKIWREKNDEEILVDSFPMFLLLCSA